MSYDRKCLTREIFQKLLLQSSQSSQSQSQTTGGNYRDTNSNRNSYRNTNRNTNKTNNCINTITNANSEGDNTTTTNTNNTSSSAAVNAPEWLVPFGDYSNNSDTSLAKIARSNGLKCVFQQNFHEYICNQLSDRTEGVYNTPSNKLKAGELFERMFAYNYEYTVTDAEWEIIG